MTRTTKPNCTHHCVSCEACFSSLVAFDYHRTGDHKTNSRACRHYPGTVLKEESTTFALRALDGICNLTTDHIGEDVPSIIWNEV